MKIKELKELLSEVDDELDVQFRSSHQSGFEPKNILGAFHGKFFIDKNNEFREVSGKFPFDEWKECEMGKPIGEGYPIKRFFSITVDTINTSKILGRKING